VSNNLILFPGYLRRNGVLWHGCRKYRHVGEMKEAISAKDWARSYQWDLRRFLRGEFEVAEPRGGNAA
jgi:hypothetical protein